MATKILEICDNLENSIGGIAEYCHNLRRLFEGSSEVCISILTIKDIKHIYFMKRINKKYISILELYRYIRQNKFDVIHINGFASLIVIESFLVSILLGKRILYSPHYHPIEELSKPKLFEWIFRIFMRPLIHRADVVVTINNEDTSFFKRFSKRVVRVPHWNYNCPEFHNNIRVIPRLLFVGRWEEAKGVEYVEMASTLCSSITCIVPYKVKRLNKSITFKSNLSRHELDEEYERSGIIIIPSKYEAFSFVALEALQMEKIVLMSNKVRILDYLDGLPNVIIFEYGNPEDFLLKLKNILRVREVQVDPEHYSKTMEQFTPLRAYTSYLNIFRSIAS